MSPPVGNSDWPVTKCEMPDLSDLNSAKSIMQMMHRAFLGSGSRDPAAVTLSINFVRLTDHLILEYENCREQIRSFIEHSSNGHFSPYPRAVCHMETAVTTIVRAIRLAQRIRKWKHDPPLPVPKKATVLSADVERKVVNVRNAIEHVYGEVPQAGITTTTACLVLKTDRLECSGNAILFSDFAKWIRDLDPIAEALATYKQPT